MTHTQGEHAQTEALRPKFGDLLRNTMASESNPRRDAYFIREVHRSGGGVNPGRWFEMTDGKGETWLSNPQNLVQAAPAQPAELAHELFAAAQLAPGEGIEDAVSRIAAALTAPQGVAYAELPEPIWRTAQGIAFSERQLYDFADRTHALRASNGQAPAGATAQEVDNLFSTLRYVLGIPSASGTIREHWQALLDKIASWPLVGADAVKSAASARARELATTAQAAPAADYDHSPQSLTVAEAARHVGKWLNERPNSPLDLRDVAMLCAHAQKAPVAGAVAGPITDNPKPGEKYWDISGGLAREQIWQGLSPEWDLLDAGLLFWNEADAVAALSIPASTVVSESEDVQRARIIAAIAQRWIGDRTHLGALVYLDDLAWALKTLAAAPTPAAQADSVMEDAARIYTYKNQPGDNVIAWRFGEAAGLGRRLALMGGAVTAEELQTLHMAEQQGRSRLEKAP